MPIHILKQPISRGELKSIAQERYGDLVKFDSMVNLKPSFGNRSRSIENSEIKEKIKAVVKKLIIE